ncbi:MAG TPA: transglutaminase domain-containing protein [Nitrospirota bacterium]|nr:transglutaminase domain-containing protein [Nitrospirota bacterium]
MIRRIAVAVGAVVILALPAFGGERKGSLTFEFDLNAPADAKDVRLWVPYPLSDANQQITDVSVTGNFTSKSVTKEEKSGVTALYVEWEGPAVERKLTYRFTVARKELITRAFPKKEGPVPSEMKPYLDLSRLGKSEKRIKEIAADVTKGKTTVLEKARAVYGWVVENMRRDPNVKGCGLGEVDRLLVDRGGKCADIHAVFAALARAAGVPTRELYGIRLHKDKEGDITKFQHCWAEFFLPGYGWVVVDPADVLKFKLEKTPTPEELKAKAEYFFGAVDENRLQLSMGDHVVLNPAPKAGELLYFMYPHAEADGKPLGEDLYGFNIGYKITFKER